MPFKITQIWAYVMVGDDGDEGIPALTVPGPGGAVQWVPAVGADEARVRSLLPAVRHIAAMSGKTFRLVRFSQMTDVTESIEVT